MLTKWLWALFVQLFEFHSRIPFGIQASWGGLIGLWERVREEKKRSLRNLNRRRGHRGDASALCSFWLTRSGRFCLTANDPLGHRFLRSPVPYRTQSSDAHRHQSKDTLKLDMRNGDRKNFFAFLETDDIIALTLQIWRSTVCILQVRS